MTREERRTGPVVVYGATGYTGRLVAEELLARGERVVLSGRSAERLDALAERLGEGVEDVVPAALDDAAALRDAAGRGPVLANCAGPFARTGDAVLAAATAAGAHYLDTTGEQHWMRRVFDHHDGALRAAGVAAIPGMGFDYVPGDLLCHLVGRELQPLRRVTVAYDTQDFGMTRGTMRSALEMMDGRDVVYEGGRWRTGGARPVREHARFPAPLGRRLVARYPAGEILTVPRHLQVREVVARLTAVSIAPRAVAPVLPAATPVLSRLLRGRLKGALDAAIGRLPEGPPEGERRAVRWTIVAIAEGEGGQRAAGVVTGPDIYGLTAHTIAEGAQRLAAPTFTGVGALGPAGAFDAAELLDALAPFGVQWRRDDALAA
jgi:short subunit dehydrogenase-like uncharacterized protein